MTASSIPLYPTSITPDAVLAPERKLFALRSQRLHTLAATHPLAPWLHWLAALWQAQQEVADAQAPLADSALPPSLEPLQAILPALVQALQATDTPQPSKLTHYTLRAAAGLALRTEANLALARGEANGGSRDLADILVAASLQVAWQAWGRHQVAQGRIKHDGGLLCPCCGSAPVGSIVFAGAGRAGLRYLECSLCATRWNAVRAHCTLCPSDAVVTYMRLLDADAPAEPSALRPQRAAVEAETCPDCRGYSKVYLQSQDINVDPTADDLASLTLDVLVGEEGFGRASPNLFLIDAGGETT